MPRYDILLRSHLFYLAGCKLDTRSVWFHQEDEEWGEQPAVTSSARMAMDADDAGDLQEEEERRAQANAQGSRAVVDFDPNRDRQIILHEDKQYYPDAEQVLEGASNFEFHPLRASGVACEVVIHLPHTCGFSI